jgi:hypothetical protein
VSGVGGRCIVVWLDIITRLLLIVDVVFKPVGGHGVVVSCSVESLETSADSPSDRCVVRSEKLLLKLKESFFDRAKGEGD